MDDNTSAASIYNCFNRQDSPLPNWERLVGIAEVFLDSDVDTVWIAHYSDLVTVTLADMDEWLRLRKLRRCVARVAPGRRCGKGGMAAAWIPAPYCEEHAPWNQPKAPATWRCSSLTRTLGLVSLT